ncbi:MAG TPA: choice-of-anchor Q domain-containing protein [Kofleriaceae bacterium]|nr:choice-of-anchor Q domain-containing protein [Kofleriaceae bacterium]
MRGLAIAIIAACSSHGGGGTGGDDDGSGSGSGGNVADAGVPAATCTAIAPVDVSSPTATVGTGTATSCTAAALQTAATAGGTIVFSCGSAPVTIAIAQTIMIPDETVIDGGKLVTLDGGGATRILYLDSNYNATTPRLTVQNLAFHAGMGPGSGDDTARGGGAIYRNGGSLTVIDAQFDDNHAGATGQDLAGGAIYGFGGGETVISGSTFTNNSASDGGAVGSLNGNLTVVNSTFSGNSATGSGGNPGDGGCGGGLYMDGTHEATSLCGVTIANNTAGAIGGGFFRVSNDHTGTFAMDRTTVATNRTPADTGNAGGLYLEGLAVAMTASTISNNAGAYCGGLWLDAGSAALTNLTIASNTATASNGGGVWLANSPTGTMTNCTIANNQATASGQVAGAIFSTGLLLANTIIANNTAQYDPSCEAPPLAGSAGNLQWPSGSPCTTSPKVADPMLGALGSNGGPTATMMPAAGSPAAGLGTTDCPATDQLGNARATPCTAGAVELP